LEACNAYEPKAVDRVGSQAEDAYATEDDESASVIACLEITGGDREYRQPESGNHHFWRDRLGKIQ
jgi:hypothetical protein